MYANAEAAITLNLAFVGPYLVGNLHHQYGGSPSIVIGNGLAARQPLPEANTPPLGTLMCLKSDPVVSNDRLGYRKTQ